MVVTATLGDFRLTNWNPWISSVIYSIQAEIKDTTYIARSDSYLDLHINIENEDLLRMKLPKR
jgi:hypothetical protein